MTARTAGADHTFATESERRVFERVVHQLGEDALVIPNLRLTDDHKDHEVDLLVLLPGAGIVTVEVKGSHCWVENGQWWIRRHEGSQRIHPVEQALQAKYALRHYVEADPRWSGRRRVRWGHHIVLANTPLDDGFATPDCPRWQVSGAGDLNDLGGRLWDTVELHQNDAVAPTREDVDLIGEILQGRFLPARDTLAEAADRESRANRLTLEQANLLRVTRLLNRVEVRGGAGSGKTVMAMQQARDLASGRLADDGARQRVAMVCYSRGLASFLQRELLTGSRAKRPAFVGTYEQLANRWGIETASETSVEFWEHDLAERMAARALGLGPEERFDAIIVDEAQDFADTWWTPLLRALRDEADGGLYVYSDEFQRVFPRFGRPPVGLIPLVLDRNLRNTRQIAQSFEPLAPKMLIGGTDGPEVTLVACDVHDALQVADEQVDALFDEGWEARDIALVTVGKRHPVQVERFDALGAEGYWDDFWSGDDIFYGHVLGLKGLERRAVVLCVNLTADKPRAAEMLYVGLSRATDRLIVVGDPAELSKIDDGVAARLRASAATR